MREEVGNFTSKPMQTKSNSSISSIIFIFTRSVRNTIRCLKNSKPIISFRINKKTLPIIFNREYFILISNKKFDDNCRKCFVDSYGRCRIKPSGELKDYITTQTINRDNIDIEYIESTSEYDVYKLE